MQIENLGNITIKIGSGSTPSGGKESYKESGISLIRSMNVYDFQFDKKGLAYIDEVQAKKLNGVTVEENDILFNITGDSINRTCIVPKEILPARVNQHVSIIRCKNGISPQYVNYFLINLKSYLMQICGVGGTRNALTKEALEKLPIKIQSNQFEIAKVLSDLDAKIELNNKINAELEAMAKLIYDYWFVQFEFPISTEQAASMGKPQLEGKPYKSSGGKMVWNDELKREVPEGWEVGNFGTYCKSSGGYAFKSSWWSDNGLKVVKIKDIQEDYTINISDLSSASISGENIDNKFIAKPGNILIAMTGATVGKFGIVPITDGPLYVNQRVGFFNLGTEPIGKLPFLVNSLNQKYFREAIFTLASGAAQPNISNEQINNIQLLIPRKTLLENYNKTLKANYNKILLNQYQNQKLAELRDWLLPMLMNGQVKVDKLSDKEEPLNMAAEEREMY